MERRKIMSDNIKKFVEESLETKTNIAKNIGVSRGQLYRYMSGEDEPKIVTLYLLSKFLNISFPRFVMTNEEWTDFVYNISLYS